MKKNTITKYVFTLACLFAITFVKAQFLESFDTEIPHGWTVIDNDNQGGTWQYNAGDAYSGAGEARINFEQNAHDDYLISPQFTVNDGVADQVSFYAGGTGATFPESFDVKLSVTGTNPSDFTVLLGSETTISDVDDLGAYINYTYNMSAYDGQDVYVAIVATSTAAFHLYLDEFSVEALASCPKPSNINIQNLNATSLDLSWTQGGSESDWTVKYGVLGFDPEREGESKSVTGSPNTSIFDLEPGTLYDVYVKAVCGNGDGESEFAGPLGFSTPCLAATTPFVEGFENGYKDGEELGGCWSQELITGSTWKVNNSITANNRSPRTGDWDIYMNYGSEAWIFYPITVQSGTSYTLTFYAIESHTSGADISASYGVSASSRDMTNEIIPMSEISDGDYQEVSGTFTPANTGVLYVGIKGHVNGGFYPFYMTLDDISINEIPSCLNPTDLQIDSTNPTTADISWTPGSSESDWVIKYGEPGFNPETEGDSAQVNGTPNVTISNLTPAHIYSILVQAQCGGLDGNSSFTGPLTLKTPPANDALCNAVSLEIDRGCTGNAYTNVGASVETNEPQGSCFDAAGSQTVWFTFEAPLGGNVTVTTDFEGGTLEDTEVAIYNAPTDCTDFSTLGTEVGCDEDGGDVGSGFLSVATLTNLTAGNTYYIQVNGFETFDEGTLEGTFCIEVQDNGPTCPAPTDVIVENITPTTADVSWRAGGNESEWEIVYGEAGFDPTAGGTFVEDNNGVLGETISNLTPETDYDVYVRAKCDSNDESVLSQVASFTTLVAPPTNDNVCNATPLIVGEVCTGNTYTNIGATVERDEPIGSCFNQLPTNTVWFTFEAPARGNVTVTTNISPSDLQNTQMAVYEAPTDCTDLTTMSAEFGCNDDVDFDNNEFLSTILLTGLTAGETYYIQVNGYSGDEDTFCIEVLDDGIACPQPNNIVVSNVATTTVDVSWTAGGNETEWEVKYGATGFDPTSAGMSVIDSDGSAGIGLIDLEPDTGYDVYVRAICNMNTESDFTGPQSFNTMVLSVANQQFISFRFYPNPVENQLVLKANMPIENVEIYNVLGQTIIEVKENTQQLEMNTTKLQTGIYFMKVTINEAEKIFRIIKE